MLRAAILALIASFCLAPPAFSEQRGSGDAPSRAEYQSKLETLRKNISELQRELKAVKGDREKLLQLLEENETETSDLLKQIDEIERELESEEQALNRLKGERQRLVREQTTEKKHIARQVRTAYLLGRQSNLKILLNQDDPEVVSRTLKYHDYFLKNHAANLAAYLDRIDQLDRVESDIVKSTRSLRLDRERLDKRHRALNAKQTERERLLARLDETIESKDRELQKLARDREHVEKLMAEIVASVGSQTDFNRNAPFADLRGQLPWPANGKITHRFGSDRIPGKIKWDGVVIRTEEGTPVKAIHHGRVVFADYLRGQGLLIIVDHGDGYMSLYAHNQSLNKKTGNWVEAGETIAHVGSSGGQRKAGLYFEIRQNGKPTNPSGWCG